MMKAAMCPENILTNIFGTIPVQVGNQLPCIHVKQNF
jgi:hypothetical protein